MIDEIFDRTYQQGRADLNDGLDRLFSGIGKSVGGGLAALHRFEWSAPWAAQAPRKSRKGRTGSPDDKAVRSAGAVTSTHAAPAPRFNCAHPCPRL